MSIIEYSQLISLFLGGLSAAAFSLAASSPGSH